MVSRVGKIMLLSQPRILRILIQAFCRQNGATQRQKNHYLSLEHQKSVLKP
jgi:hypothetical protein